MAGRKKNAGAGEPIARTEAEAAVILGLKDRSSIAGYIRRGCPGGTGNYPLLQMREWITANIQQNGRSVTGGPADEDTSLQKRLELAEVLKAEADAATRQAKLGVLLGALVERSLVAAELRSLFNGIRHRLQAIPDEIAITIPTNLRPDVTLVLTSKMEMLLQELAECSPLPSHQPPPAASEDSEPPPLSPTPGKSRSKRTGSASAAKRSAPSKSRPSSRGRGKK